MARDFSPLRQLKTSGHKVPKRDGGRLCGGRNDIACPKTALQSLGWFYGHLKQIPEAKQFLQRLQKYLKGSGSVLECAKKFQNLEFS